MVQVVRMKGWFRTWTVLLALAAILPGGPSAGAVSARLDYHVADAFLSDITGVPQTGAVAQVSEGDFSGDLLRVSGSGSFNIASGTSTGGGVWAHTDAEGTLLANGTWRATAVEGFEPFGCGGDALPSNFCGGVLTLAVHLSGVHVELGPEEVDGLLTILCSVGPEAPPDTEDVITFTPIGLPIDFDTGLVEPGGLTLFVSRSRA